MHAIWVISKREFNSFFDSLVSYIFIVVFLGIGGFFTWLFGSDVFLVGQATLQPFFSIAYFTLFFFIPALTMRMIAEEKRIGTIELLLTKAVSDWDVLIGKFLACLILIGVALALTLPYYITVWALGPIDHGAVWCGYLGMILMSMAYISIGLFASSITNNQIVSFLLALFIGVFFLIIFDVLSGNFTGTVGQILDFMSMSSHFDSISRGVIDSRDLIYFLSITVIGLLLAQTSLSKRNIVE